MEDPRVDRLFALARAGRLSRHYPLFSQAGASYPISRSALSR